jgi:hypothetical protein
VSGEPRLLILPEHWHDLGYRYQEVWAKIQTFDCGRATFILTPDDLRAVHADRWGLALTPAASARLKEQFGTYLDSLAMTKAVFVAAVGEVKLFGGVFIEVGSAAAIRFPVIYPYEWEDPFVLLVRPFHDIFWRFTAEDLGANDPPHNAVPDLTSNRDAIRSFFGQFVTGGNRRTKRGRRRRPR